MSNLYKSSANPALSQFEPLIGRWIATITWSENIHKFVGGPRTVRGRASFEWAKDRYFVVHSTGGEDEGSPFAHWMIGRDDTSGAFAAFYADNRGQSRIYEMSLTDNVWKMWRRSNGSCQRFTAQISPDQRKIEARWESSRDDTAWEEEFAIVYAKEAN
jgi:hypothetical protein